MIFFDNNLGKLAPQFALHFKNKTCTTTRFFFLSFFLLCIPDMRTSFFQTNYTLIFLSLEQNRTQ